MLKKKTMSNLAIILLLLFIIFFVGYCINNKFNFLEGLKNNRDDSEDENTKIIAKSLKNIKKEFGMLTKSLM